MSVMCLGGQKSAPIENSVIGLSKFCKLVGQGRREPHVRPDPGESQDLPGQRGLRGKSLLPAAGLFFPLWSGLGRMMMSIGL